MKRIETEYYLIGFTDEKTSKEFLELVKSKLGKGVNSWMMSETIEDMKDNIVADIEHFNDTYEDKEAQEFTIPDVRTR